MTRDSTVSRSILAPTYVGHREPSARVDYTDPQVPIAIEEDRGLRIVLGTTHPRELKPDVQIERRPNGWAIFLHPLGGSDPCALVYFHDDGRSWLTKELTGPTPELIECDNLPPEIDA